MSGSPCTTTEGAPRPGRPLAVDDHGRRLSTTPEAAAHYRAAQRAAPRIGLVRRALGEAIGTDPRFALARAALAALGPDGAGRPDRPATSWERRHLDVVDAVRAARPRRAADLLREHLLDVGCDPLACLVVVHALDGDEIDDLVANAPGCHPLILDGSNL